MWFTPSLIMYTYVPRNYKLTLGKANDLLFYGGNAYKLIITNNIAKSVFQFLGPDLPFRLHGSSMVTSPTDEGVVIIGGYNHDLCKESYHLIEIMGNSVETLEWNLLEQRLKYARSAHLAFAIPYEMYK